MHRSIGAHWVFGGSFGGVSGGVLVGLLALGGCSALIEPDESRLGGGLGPDAATAGVDAGVRQDGSVTPGVDAGPSGDRDGGPAPMVDGGPPPGRDGGPVGFDGGCPATPVCVDGRVVSCEGVVDCPLGCAPGGGASCAEMVPSNVPPTYWRAGAESIALSPGPEPVYFDTTECEAMRADSEVTSQMAGGPEVCVLMVHDLTVERGGRLLVFGSRPLVIMATGDVVVAAEGVLDASAHGPDPGPGGGRGGRPDDPDGEGLSPGRGGGHVERFDDGAGGGGAFSGRGGDGGRGGDAAGGEGGDPVDSALLIPLRGGSGGGLGEGGRYDFGGDPGNVGLGGAGGGGLQISALGTIRIEGQVLAGGGGGRGGGNRADLNWGAGGGGGSGGGVLLEAPSIVLGNEATVTTSGGGGGGGASRSSPGGDGQDGAETLGAATAGRSGGPGFGAPGGISGGADALDGEAGGDNGNGSANGGGGGGGAGHVVYRTLDGALPERAAERTSGSREPSLQHATIMLR